MDVLTHEATTRWKKMFRLLRDTSNCSMSFVQLNFFSCCESSSNNSMLKLELPSIFLAEFLVRGGDDGRLIVSRT